MKKLLALVVLLGIGLPAFGQKEGLYWAFLRDKQGSQYSLDQPQQFLSRKALDRRAKWGLPITQQDLPVSRQYLEQLHEMGFGLWQNSKWLNAAMIRVEGADTAQLAQLSQKPFVLRTQYLGPLPAEDDTLHLDQDRPQDTTIFEEGPQNYGNAETQVRMLGAHQLHEEGYFGEGIEVAVLDAGFRRVETHKALRGLFLENRLGYHHDFVTGTNDVFEDSNHGAMVLSTMAAYWPGKLIGLAPKATYHLLRTENSHSEFLVECANWVVAAEKADSLGADLLTTSLGYTTFDDTSQNFQLARLNGDHYWMSQAADIAAAKGMVVVNSAGNEGNNSSWQGNIVVPADADSVICVGAVDADGQYADFSSRGPLPDGRTKPDVSALGVNTRVMSSFHDEAITASNGTSFSGPVLTGFLALLMEKAPEVPPNEWVELLRAAGTQSKEPSNIGGYGIPKYRKIEEILEARQAEGFAGPELVLAPNQVMDEPIRMLAKGDLLGKQVGLKLVDPQGKTLHQENIGALQAENTLKLRSTRLPKGLFYLRVNTAQKVYILELVKL